MIGHSVIFNHHCPLARADHEHFRRCAARLCAQLRAPGRKLFLLLSNTPLELTEVRAPLPLAPRVAAWTT